MRCDDHGFAILNVWLEALEPISTGTREPVEREDPASSKHAIDCFVGFEWSVELPACIGGIEIVRRDEHLEAIRFSGGENPLPVLDGIVFLHAPPAGGANEAPPLQQLFFRACGDFSHIGRMYFL